MEAPVRLLRWQLCRVSTSVEHYGTDDQDRSEACLRRIERNLPGSLLLGPSCRLTFQSAVSHTTGVRSSPPSVVVADLDGNGQLDLVLAHFNWMYVDQGRI